MKRIFLTLSVIVTSAFMMYGQARVHFNNYVTGNPITVSGVNQGPSGGSAGAYVGANYSVQLRWVAGTYADQWAFDAANPSSSAPVAFLGTTGGSPSTDGAGLFDGGIVVLGGPAGTYTMEVRAWYNGGIYSTYHTAQVALKNIGRSVLFTVNATASPTPAPNTIFPAFQVSGPLSLPQYIISQPQSRTVYSGENVTFSVAAGGRPVFYQWRKNGSSISGANWFSYTITNVSSLDAGNYDVLVSGISPTITSAVAVLQILPGKPVILLSPLSQTAEVGSTVEFLVVADVALSLAYQWFFDGTNPITGATHSMLELMNVPLSQSGDYSVVVTNTYGAVTSAPALLNVIAPVERRWVPGLVLAGQTGSALNLHVTEALVPAPNWVAFDSVMLTSAFQWYFDLSTPLLPQRFYRASQAGTPAPPLLDAHVVPALTLTGSIGNTVRVDAINQFGPTDAWFPLATVTLTNTSQLYFDVSVIGQPPRLWRLVATP